MVIKLCVVCCIRGSMHMCVRVMKISTASLLFISFGGGA